MAFSVVLAVLAMLASLAVVLLHDAVFGDGSAGMSTGGGTGPGVQAGVDPDFEGDLSVDNFPLPASAREVVASGQTREWTVPYDPDYVTSFYASQLASLGYFWASSPIMSDTGAELIGTEGTIERGTEVIADLTITNSGGPSGAASRIEVVFR